VLDKFVAGVGLAVCVVLLTRLLLGDRRRRRWDAKARRFSSRCRGALRRIIGWRTSRRAATAAAQDAIARARGAGVTEGNVIRPRAFRHPRKPH